MVKPNTYAKFRVSYYWLGDPRNRTLETFVVQNGVLKLAETYRNDNRVAAPPFGEVPFSLGRLWKE